MSAGGSYLDPKTWEIHLANGGPSAEADLNTPEKKRARYLATLAIENPNEYDRLYPKSPEKIKQEEAATYAVTHPNPAPSIATFNPKETDARLRALCCLV